MKTLMMLIGFWCFSLWASSSKQFLPLSSELKVSGAQVEITLKAKSNIPELEVVSIHGIDGLTILSSDLPDKQDLKAGDKLVVTAQVQKPAGRSYLSLSLNSKGRLQNLNFAVGAVSAKQRAKKSSSIKSVNGKKRHVLKIEAKK